MSDRVDGVRWHPAPGLTWADHADRLVRAVRAVRSGDAEQWKRGRQKALYVVREPVSGRPELLLKMNRYAGFDRARRALGGGKARRELAIAAAAAAGGVATPLPIAAGEVRSARGLEADYLAVPFVEGARDLRRLVVEGALPCAQRREVARALGDQVRRLAAAGLHQDDLAPNNVLVGPSGVQLIDFERTTRKRGDDDAVWRAVAKLDRELAGTTRGDRMRFLLGLLGSPARARAAWPRVLAAGARLARRDHRRLQRLLLRGGRRFVRTDSDGVRRVSRRGEHETSTSQVGERRCCTWSGGASAEDAFARAEVLHHRGLGPRPLTAISEGAERRLVLDTAAPPEPETAPSPHSLGHLARRLHALGELEAPLGASDVAAAPRGAPQGLWLTNPLRVRFGGRPSTFEAVQ